MSESEKIAEAEPESLRDSDDAPEALSVMKPSSLPWEAALEMGRLNWPLELKI